ncbi:hypothetical protein [Roseovarius sp. E0-M6]|uniref:hypothetical protein n=1 Tax=Roseovarius sp. E0-M6 TaxID=3127118 RepID=UPI00301020A6
MTFDFGHDVLNEIPERIFCLAEKSIISANRHATYLGPGIEHWPAMSVLNASHACELFIKASIATHHPLLIFKDAFNFSPDEANGLSLENIIAKGRSHDFANLPKIYWAVTGKSLNRPDLFEDMRQTRNALQHFVEPEHKDLSELTLRFIYEVVDPLINSDFGIHALEYYEDINDGYDYTVDQLIKHEIEFSMPSNFCEGEVSWDEALADVNATYREWFHGAFLKATGTPLKSENSTCPH